MKSPFPGMDPYLEARWSDVHAKLIAFIGEALQPGLPSGMRARSEERVLLEDDTGEPLQWYRSDVALLDMGLIERRRAAGGVAQAEPMIVEFDDGPVIDRYVQIIDTTSGNRLVTAIEVLSPWNKSPGRLNDSYCKKIDSYGRAGVSVVQIDLLRSDRKRLPIKEEDLPAKRGYPYYVSIRKAWEPKRWFVYPIDFPQPLPEISVPLRQTDKEVGLKLQPLMDRVYVAGGHDDIDYSEPPKPPLIEEDVEWCRQLLKDVKAR